MALGEFPNQVPKRYLLKAEKILDKTKLLKFENVSKSLGVDASFHAGGAIMDDFNNDGFLDIIEIKRPDSKLKFWADTLDHGNYVPSSDLIKAITQATKYIYEVEREANSVKFLERVGNVKTIKPRCILIFGRSHDWIDTQKETYRILNASYHNLLIMTYDHVLSRAKRILGIDEREETPFQ